MATGRGKPRSTESPIVNALAALGEYKERQDQQEARIEELEKWREDVQEEAEFMAQMTARARTRRQDRLRVLMVAGGLATVGIQFATLALIVLRHG